MAAEQNLTFPSKKHVSGGVLKGLKSTKLLAELLYPLSESVNHHRLERIGDIGGAQDEKWTQTSTFFLKKAI